MESNFPCFNNNQLNKINFKTVVIQAESELEDLKHELESVLGKENLQRRMSVARSVKTTLSDFHSDTESIDKKGKTKKFFYIFCIFYFTKTF